MLLVSHTCCLLQNVATERRAWHEVLKTQHCLLQWVQHAVLYTCCQPAA